MAMENLYHSDGIPNDGHHILAIGERQGRMKKIITQNIDNLHEKAGSREVIEFHRTMNSLTCVNCEAKYSAEEMKKG